MYLPYEGLNKADADGVGGKETPLCKDYTRTARAAIRACLISARSTRLLRTLLVRLLLVVQILGLLQEAANHEAARDPNVAYEQPLSLDETLVERLENAVEDLTNEANGLEVR